MSQKDRYFSRVYTAFPEKSVHIILILIVLIYELSGKEAVLWVFMFFLCCCSFPVAIPFKDYFRLDPV
jgi:hypothetical protein